MVLVMERGWMVGSVSAERAAGGSAEFRSTVEWLAERLALRPRVVLVLGSGLGQLGNSLTDETRWGFSEIPHWPQATVVGHQGNLIAGRCAGVEVLALQGRFHLYEGYSWQQVVMPIRVAWALGATGLVVSNAAGGLNPGYRCGDLMGIESHLNWLFDSGARVLSGGRRLVQSGGAGFGVENVGDAAVVSASRGGANRDSGLPYDSIWLERFIALSRLRDVVVHRGAYAAVTGPNYETRAEYRAFRRMGADAVGMSTVPEVLEARSLGMRVLGVSVITNEARPDRPVKNDPLEVIAQAQAAEGRLESLLHAWLAEQFG